MSSSVTKGFVWKLLERFGVQGTQFVLQIVLARLLLPEYYGALSIMLIFVNLANVFVQTGLNTALIQNKDVTEEDYSSVFWVVFGVSLILYGIVFAAAPLVGLFYEMPEIVTPLRVLALMLLPGAFNSIQLARVSRKLEFRKVFISSLGGILVSGGIAVWMAYANAGLWALVVYNLLNITVTCGVMLVIVRWFPRFVINWRRIGTLFSFGWKLLVSELTNNLYQDLRSLVVGKKYNNATLGYYNRGKQFPQFFINAVNGTVQSVMLPAMAQAQDDRARVKQQTRNSIILSSYIILPLMAGLAAVASPLVAVLLTDKWLPCVPYLQMYCFTLAFYPIHSCNLQAINSIGRSDVFLRLEVIKKTIGIVALVVAVFCFDSPLAIAATGMITTLISTFINASPNKRLIGYSYFEQARDLAPSFLISIAMCGSVWALGLLPLAPVWLLLIQIPAGIAIYVALSALFRLKPFFVVVGAVKSKLLHKAAPAAATGVPESIETSAETDVEASDTDDTI